MANGTPFVLLLLTLPHVVVGFGFEIGYWTNINPFGSNNQNSNGNEPPSPSSDSIKDTFSNPFAGNGLNPFSFVLEMKGWNGEEADELPKLKQYLARFGYIMNTTEADSEYVQTAIKAFQINYNLEPTGKLDNATVNIMAKPRCGVPDIYAGSKTRMRLSHKELPRDPSTLNIVSHYGFFHNSPKWNSSMYNLTYKIGSEFYNPINNVVDNRVLKRVLQRAFHAWETVTPFRFTYTEAPKADIWVGFHRDWHNDTESFDGPHGTLGHAYSPPTGVMHLDADEIWSTNPKADQIDLQSVCVHEIGHVIGLDHSSVKESIMYPTLPAGFQKRRLHEDDIDGIRNLYGLPKWTAPPSHEHAPRV